MSSVRIDANGRETHQVSVWLPVDVIRLIRADRLNLTRFILEQLELFYGLDAGSGDREHRDRLATAARTAFEQQRKIDAEREAELDRVRAVARRMRADREATAARQAEITAALAAIVGKRAGQYRRVLPENDPYGDHINEWDALVAGVSRRCGTAVDPAEVAGALRALVAASA